jgi:hypothetical protein
MHALQTLTLLALAALTSAAPSGAKSPLITPRQTDNNTQFAEPLTIGQFSYDHGHQILAWTPTKTTMLDACDQTGTTELQAVNSGFYSGPLCGVPFTVDGRSNLTLECSDGTGVTASQATAVATNGEVTHKCVGLPDTVFVTECGVGTGIMQLFSCQ